MLGVKGGIDMTFGEKIQKLRKEAGLSQEELSYQLGVSRQAVSKWERDNGYPETEKIVRMSKIFHVTLDYLLNEEDERKPGSPDEEKGIYVSQEMAEGFLIYQRIKMMKIGGGAGIMVAGMAFSYLASDLGILGFMLMVILGIVLLFAARLNDNPYRSLWREPLLFDKKTRSKLSCDYADRKRKIYIGNLAGIALIAAGFLILPLVVPVEYSALDDLALGAGMILAGSGIFLCVYMWGTARAYRLLIMNEEYGGSRK